MGVGGIYLDVRNLLNRRNVVAARHGRPATGEATGRAPVLARHRGRLEIHLRQIFIQ